MLAREFEAAVKKVGRARGDGLRASLPGATPIPDGVRSLAAVSGGPDSTALLVWLRESGRHVVAAHYDHAIRAGSEADTAHVAELCEALGVELVSERRREPLPRGSVQAAARTLRYAFLERAQRAADLDVVLLAHTADDVVEGAILHLLRGSGLAGMRGMPERRGPFLRPFLGVWREDVEAYLEARGLTPLRDPANEDLARFARARVRHLLIPRLERDRPGLSRRLWAAARSAEALQTRLERAAGDIGADRKALGRAPRAVRLEAYRQMYARQPALSRRHLDAMDALALGGRAGAGLDLPGGLRFNVEAAGVSIEPPSVAAPAWPTLRSKPCPGCADAHAVHLKVGLRLSLGRRAPGLRMRPVGAPGTRKLQDILTDAKVPRRLRDQLPLVFADGRLAWVPGIAVDVDSVAERGEPAQHVWLEQPVQAGPGIGVPESNPTAYQGV